MEEGLLIKYFQQKEKEEKKGRVVYDDQDWTKGEAVLPPSSSQTGEFANFQKSLRILRDHSQLPVKDVPAHVQEELEKVMQTMGFHQKTPAYDTYAQMIQLAFQDQRTMEHDTVGSTVAGCFHRYKNADLVEPGCTPTCARALSPNSQTPKCSHSIFMAVSTGHKWRLDPYYKIDQSKAYIYVPRGRDGNFRKPKLKPEDHVTLRQNGILGYKFVGYDSSNGHLEELDREYIMLQNTPKSVETTESRDLMVSPTRDYTGWVIMGLLFLFFVVYYLYTRSNAIPREE